MAPGVLMRLLSWNLPLVSALVFMRQAPCAPMVWFGSNEAKTGYRARLASVRRWFAAHKEYIPRGDSFVMEPRPDDALDWVDFTSTSCILIHRVVFEKMKKEVRGKWFVWDDDVKGGGEDRRFCGNAKRVGYDTFVDRSCVAGHMAGDVPVSVMDFMAWDQVSQVFNTDQPHELIDCGIAGPGGPKEH
jgi:hypothetical protein